MIKHALDNWKTTSAGITMIAGGVVQLVFKLKAHTADETVWTVSIGAVVAGLGLILAGDAGKSVQVKDVQVDPGTGVLKQSDAAATKTANENKP